MKKALLFLLLVLPLAKSQQITVNNVQPNSKQGTTGTKFQLADTVAAGAGNPLCTDINGNDTTAGCPAFQSPITTGTTAQYFRGDLSLSTFPTTWAWLALTGIPSAFTPVNTGDWAGTWQSHAPAYFQTALPAPSAQLQYLRAQPNSGGYVLGFAGSHVIATSDTDYSALTSLTPSTLTGGAGLQTITVSVCPIGIYAGGVWAPVELSAGVGGTAEAVIPGGGSCSSSTLGVDSGTIIVSPLYNHGTGYAITSATGGVVEAVSFGGNVLIDHSSTFRATATIGTNVSLQCTAGITLTQGFSGTSIFTLPGTNVMVSGCTISGTGGASSVGLVNITGSHIVLANSTIKNSSGVGVYLNGDHVLLKENTILGNTTAGIGGSGLETYITIDKNNVSSVGCPSIYCGAIGVWGSHYVITNNHVEIGGNQDGGIVWPGIPSANIVDATITNNIVTVLGATSYECGAVAGVGFTLSDNICDASGAGTNPRFGWEFNLATDGVAQGNVFRGSGSGNTTGLFLESPNRVTVNGGLITNYGAGGQCVFFQHTNSTSGMSDNLVSHVVCKNASATSSNGAADIWIDTLTTGTVKNNLFTGNTVSATTTSGHSCIGVGNSGSATETGTSFKNNSVSSCANGFYINGASGVEISNNTISDTTAPINVPNTSTLKVIDFSSMTYAQYHAMGSLLSGSNVYVSNATIASCATAGTGAFARWMGSSPTESCY